MAPTIPKKMPSKVSEISKEVCVCSLQYYKRSDLSILGKTKEIKILQHLSLTKTYASRQDLGAGDMDWMRGRVLLKPENQLQLTEAVRLTVSLDLFAG